MSSILNKIDCKNLKDNLDEHLKINDDFITYKNRAERVEHKPNQNWFIMRIPAIRGNGTYLKPKDDFYTIISNDTNENIKNLGIYKKIYNIKNKNGKCILKHYIPFNTNQELLNFYNYIRTDFVRICLYFIKTNTNLLRGELKYIPWFNFSDKIFSKSPTEIDDYLFKKYEINDNERQYIENILPDYYNIRKG